MKNITAQPRRFLARGNRVDQPDGLAGVEEIVGFREGQKEATDVYAPEGPPRFLFVSCTVPDI